MHDDANVAWCMDAMERVHQNAFTRVKMSFSFGFFDEDTKIAPLAADHIDNPKDGEISSPQPWWVRVALDVQSIGPAPSQCLHFIERENHLDYIQSAKIQGISPHNNRTTLTFGDGFLIDIIRPEKEIKVGDMITDLIPGQYEGGYKLWECSVDLAQYLVAFRSDLLSSLNVSTSGRPLRILELGCGIGLPGIVAQRLLPENSELWLSDFNDTVLMETTWPTLNCCPLEDAFQQGRIQRLVRRAVAGDWLALSSWLTMNNEEPFDLILSAETLYSPPHCEKVPPSSRCMIKRILPLLWHIY